MLTFKTLREISSQRSKKWNKGEPWDLPRWGNALAGETGELCNVIKKLDRADRGMVGNKESVDKLRQSLGKEIADVIIYADLLAEAAGINLAEAIIQKFNEVSERNGFDERLPETSLNSEKENQDVR